MTRSNKGICRRYGFTLALFGVVGLAGLHPPPAIREGSFYSGWAVTIGIGLIFLLQAFNLPRKELLRAYRPIRLQIFVLAWNYLLFPPVTLLGLSIFGYWLPKTIVLGFYLLSILPTTIVSAFTLTGLAGGNTSSALCSAVLSNLLAVFIVPLWVGIYLKTTDTLEFSFLPIVGKLFFLIGIPILFGQILRSRLPSLTEVAAKYSNALCSWIILFIVYTTFAESVTQGTFKFMDIRTIIGLVLVTLGLLLMISKFVWLTSALLQLNLRDRLAAFFCAGQKSMATGVPLIAVILTAMPDSAAIHSAELLLPLIIFHPLQLLLAPIATRLIERFQ